MTAPFSRDRRAHQQASPASLAYTLPHPDANLETWLLTQLGACPGENILFIGCANHEQTLSLARAVDEHGYVLAIDRSYRVLHELSQLSQAGGLEKRIRFLYLDLDDLPGHLRGESFDRAIGAQALAHLKHPQAVFQTLRQALKPGGVFFFYGPARQDLAELRHFHLNLCPHPRESRAHLFMEQIGIPCAHDAFPRVEYMKFESLLRFTSPATLSACWHSSYLYTEELESAFRTAATDYFHSHPSFETARCLVGVRAINA